MLESKLDLAIPSHRRILNLIRIHGEISGAELARASSLQPSTIVYILRSLEEKGLIEVSRIGKSTGNAGKPPTLWRLVGKTGYIIGLEVIPSEIRAEVIDFSGLVVHQEHVTGIEDRDGKLLVNAVTRFVENLIQRLTIPKSRIIGLGIALPGLVDRENGKVHYSRTLNLKNYPLQSALKEALGIEVEIVNDANAGMLGIRWHRDYFEHLPSNVVFLTLNEKIGQMGAGLILHNTLYEGAHGTAGEIFKSLPPIAELLQEEEKRHDEKSGVVSQRECLSITDVIEYARKSDMVCMDVLMRYSSFVINEMFRIVEFINPDVIIIGGDITEAQGLIKGYIEEQVRKILTEKYPLGVAVPDIEFSTLGIYSVAMGAAALILRKIFL